METKNQAWLNKSLGKQLLLKMGWKEGDGLGVNGNGLKTNISVKKIRNQSGLGFNSKTNSDTAVLKQVNELDDVLKSLQTVDDSVSSPSEKIKKKKRAKIEESEDKSKQQNPIPQSRRKHRKFLDAKDVSNYSKDDLNAIFGGAVNVYSELQNN